MHSGLYDDVVNMCLVNEIQLSLSRFYATVQSFDNRNPNKFNWQTRQKKPSDQTYVFRSDFSSKKT